MRVNKKILIKAKNIIRRLWNSTPTPKPAPKPVTVPLKPAPKPVTVPLKPTPKPANMGLVVERTAPKTVRALEHPPVSPAPLLSRTGNPYHLITDPLREIQPKTKEEFAAYLDGLRHADSKLLSRYTPEEKAKLLKLYEMHKPQYVQYLVDLKYNYLKFKYEPRFSVDEIEKILQGLKKDEKFVLNLINDVKANGKPLRAGYDIVKVIKAYEKNPVVTKLLAQKQLKSETIAKLAKLYTADSPRYKQLVESGIFDHIREGKLSEKVFENVRKNMHLSSDFLNDIKKIRSGKPLVGEIPKGTSLADIGRFIENGEVGTLNGKLYVNQCGKAVELKLSKEKFEELFPLLERFQTEQGNVGDCWLVAAINDFMSNPSQRAELYKIFSQEGDDIIIKFPRSKHSLRFVGGQPYNLTDGLEGVKGIKMLEQAFIFEKQSEPFFRRAYTKNVVETDVIARLSENPNLLKRLNGGKQGELSDALRTEPLNWKEFLLHELPSAFKPQHTERELTKWTNSGKSNTVMYSCNRGGHIVNGREGVALPEYDLFAPHSYTVKNYNPQSRMVTIQNPHDTNIEIDVPLNVLKSYGSFGFS